MELVWLVRENKVYKLDCPVSMKGVTGKLRDNGEAMRSNGLGKE